VLPWPPELSRVPLIAGAHHEKLDGSGYPDGRRGDEIPLPSKVMTVCDIFDALTSMDRP
jgi:HD-GYP domain-containing protein (c-di-GMP phosphodiesterase class II)